MVELGYKLSSEEHPASDLVGYARRAEEAGFGYAVVSDHFHPWTHRQGQSPFVWAVLGAIAQVTTRMRIGTAVTAPIRRTPPYLVAQAAATVATLMPGRFFLGVGSGENLNEHVTGEWWPPSEVRREMLEEAVDVIRKLWEGGTVEHLGKHFTVDNARIYSLPEEPPAIIFAASGEPGAELAGRVGDGLIGIEASADLVQAFAGAGGAGKPCHGEMAVCVAADRDEALRIAHAQWAAPGATPPRLSAKLRVAADFQAVADLVTEEQVAEKVVCGADADEHLARIEEFADVGFDHVSCTRSETTRRPSSASTKTRSFRESGSSEMPRAIDLAEVVRLVDAGAQLVDVLSRKEFEDSHLPGAINIPLSELDEAAVASLDREAAVVAYCFDYE